MSNKQAHIKDEMKGDVLAPFVDMAIDQNFDHFDEDSLGPEWQFVGKATDSPCSLTERPGCLRIWTGNGNSNGNIETILVRHDEYSNYTAYTATVKLDFDPVRACEQAGLICYGDANVYIKFCLIYDKGRKLQVVENSGDKPRVISEVDRIFTGSIYLKVTVNRQEREFSYSYDSETWTSAGKVDHWTFLGNIGAEDENNVHSGVMIGVYSGNGGGCESRIPADFDWFCYSGPDERQAVFVVGDSTVRNHDRTHPTRVGWGQRLAEFFPPEIKVIDEAVPGRSSKSFIDEERLLPVKNRLKPQDYLFIQFGHNDEKPDAARRTEAYTTYKAYLKKYIDVAREKGAYPVLLTSVNRRHFNAQGQLLDTHGEYPKAMRELAAELKVPLIDLEVKTRRLYLSLGDEASKKLFFWVKAGESADYPEGIEDNTHFNADGAKIIAGLVVEGIQELNIPLTKYLIR